MVMYFFIKRYKLTWNGPEVDKINYHYDKI